MSKKHKIVYWIATLWLSLGMISTGLVQLIHRKDEADQMIQLGYPSYLLTIVGIWKFLGVITVLVPGFALVKEWAYAGFFFAMSGAIISHIAVADPISESAPALLLLILTVVSWYFRPAERKLFRSTNT